MRLLLWIFNAFIRRKPFAEKMTEEVKRLFEKGEKLRKKYDLHTINLGILTAVEKLSNNTEQQEWVDRLVVARYREHKSMHGWDTDFLELFRIQAQAPRFFKAIQDEHINDSELVLEIRSCTNLESTDIMAGLKQHLEWTDPRIMQAYQNINPKRDVADIIAERGLKWHVNILPEYKNYYPPQ